MARRPETAEARRLRNRDHAQFLAAMADVRPLRSDDAVRSQPPDAEEPVTPGSADMPKPRSVPTAERAAGREQIHRTEWLSAGENRGLDRRTMERLRRGQIRPDSRLDLHGKTADEALRVLSGFIRHACKAQHRCVLVVTGKGSVRDGGGVLRREFPLWLNLPSNREHILGFVSAQPSDGGAGAFYVLLRRRRRVRQAQDNEAPG